MQQQRHARERQYAFTEDHIFPNHFYICKCRSVRKQFVVEIRLSYNQSIMTIPPHHSIITVVK